MNRKRTPLLILAGIGVVSAFAVPFVIDKVEGEDRNYANTIEEVTDKFGADAKVVSIEAGPKRATYEVLMPDGTVQIREYKRECKSTNSENGTSCDNKVEDSSRPATPDDQAATVTIGSFSDGILDEMYAAAGLDPEDTEAIFDGAVWRLDTFANPPGRWTANADGTNVQMIAEQGGVPAAPQSPKAPKQSKAPSAPAPTVAPPETSALLKCVQKAAGDVAALQACAAQ